MHVLLAMGKPLSAAQSVLLALLSGYWPSITTKHSGILTVAINPGTEMSWKESKENCPFFYFLVHTSHYRNICCQAF